MGPDTSAAATITRIERTYYSLNSLFTLSASIIWGVNTLFLLDAGLEHLLGDARQRHLQRGPDPVRGAHRRRRRHHRAAGIVSDRDSVAWPWRRWGTWGRPSSTGGSPASYWLRSCSVLASPVRPGRWTPGWWMPSTPMGYSGSKDRVFARSGIFTGISMLVGVSGGRAAGATQPLHPLRRPHRAAGRRVRDHLRLHA